MTADRRAQAVGLRPGHVRAIARRLVRASRGRIDDDDAEQEALLGALLAGVDQERHADERGAYAWQAATWHCARRATAEKREKRGGRAVVVQVEEAGDEDRVPVTRAWSDATQEDDADIDRMRSILRRALRAIPPADRRALLATVGAYGDGRIQHEHAVREGVSRQRIEQRARRAREDALVAIRLALGARAFAELRASLRG